MYIINNKFEIGEECFSVYRKPVKYKCPICEGEGHFMHNGYEIRCRNCNGTGKLHNAHQFTMDICKVRVKRVIVNMFNEMMTIKYKVDLVIKDDELNFMGTRVNNRSESNLFKTREEAEKYCEGVNTEKIVGEF